MLTLKPANASALMLLRNSLPSIEFEQKDGVLQEVNLRNGAYKSLIFAFDSWGLSLNEFNVENLVLNGTVVNFVYEVTASKNTTENNAVRTVPLSIYINGKVLFTSIVAVSVKQIEVAATKTGIADNLYSSFFVKTSTYLGCSLDTQAISQDGRLLLDTKYELGAACNLTNANLAIGTHTVISGFMPNVRTLNLITTAASHLTDGLQAPKKFTDGMTLDLLLYKNTLINVGVLRSTTHLFLCGSLYCLHSSHTNAAQLNIPHNSNTICTFNFKLANLMLQIADLRMLGTQVNLFTTNKQSSIKYMSIISRKTSYSEKLKTLNLPICKRLNIEMPVHYLDLRTDYITAVGLNEDRQHIYFYGGLKALVNIEDKEDSIQEDYTDLRGINEDAYRLALRCVVKDNLRIPDRLEDIFRVIDMIPVLHIPEQDIPNLLSVFQRKIPSRIYEFVQPCLENIVSRIVVPLTTADYDYLRKMKEVTVNK